MPMQSDAKSAGNAAYDAVGAPAGKKCGILGARGRRMIGLYGFSRPHNACTSFGVLWPPGVKDAG